MKKLLLLLLCVPLMFSCGENEENDKKWGTEKNDADGSETLSEEQAKSKERHQLEQHWLDSINNIN